ncbi:MAG: hypothetical protein WAX44_01650 [Minisyncoccia bacterium]
MYTKLISTLRNNYIAFLFSLLVGIVYIFPHVYFILDQGENYKGIYISRSYDEDTYYSSIRQIYDGKSATMNPYLPEYEEKTIVSAYKFIESIIGYLGVFFNLSISSLAILSKFIFPTLIFLSVYFFILVLFHDKLTAIFTAFFVLLGQELAPLNITSAIETFMFQSPFHSFLLFNRPINPQVSIIFFFLVLCLLAKLWNNTHSKKYAILSGIIVGFLSYIYFYYWNFTLIFLGLIFLYSIFLKEKELLKNISISIIVSLAVAMPFIVNTLLALKTGAMSVSKNYILTHRYINEKVILLPLIVFIVIYLWNTIISKKFNISVVLSFINEKKFLFIFLLVVTGFLATNQQVIHGYEIQQHHYHFMTNISVFIITMSVIFSTFLKSHINKYKLFIVSLVMFVIFIHAISVQASSYKYWVDKFGHFQDYSPVFDWLNNNSKADDVVYSSTEISEIIPVYTHNSVYGSLHASVYPVPTERLAHNYFTLMYLRGISGKEVKTYLYDEKYRNEFGHMVFEGQYWRSVCGSFGCFPDSVLDSYIKNYELLVKDSFETNLKKYKIDYILWDSELNPEWEIDKFNFVKEVFRHESIHLFSVI